MRKIVIILLIFCAGKAPAQNLLPNPSFEDTISSFFGLKFAKNWQSANKGSPDYFSNYHNQTRTNFGVPLNIFGNQPSNTGNSYIGFSIYNLVFKNDSKRYREYIQSQLKLALIKDSIYCLQLFVSLADSSRYASKNKLGVYFSANRIQSNDFFFLPFTPQIMVSPATFITEKEKWLEFNFQYKAVGGEQYITIGNFTDSTEIDTLFVGGGVDEQWKETYYYIDDVYLGSCDSIPFDTGVGLRENELIKRSLNIYPNPTKEKINFEFEVENSDKVELFLFDILGKVQKRVILQPTFQHQFDVSEFNAGIYIYKLIKNGEVVNSNKLIIQ